MSTAVSEDRRVAQLIDAATQAFERGQTQDGERLLRQAQTEAPQHPLVLNEIARHMLAAGDPAGARQLLERALQSAPSVTSLWLNLAAALRGLGRADEEMAAVEKALALEPRNLRALLQKGSLQELQGRSRAAAATYRIALQLIPPGAEPPPALRPVLNRARDAVEANNRSLETFLDERLKDVRARHGGERLDRFDRCVAMLLQKERVYRQQPSFMYFPQLPAIEFYPRGDFPWLDAIEAATDDIRAELVNVLADGPATLQPYINIREGYPVDQWRELNHSRRWGVYFLWREGVPIAEHIDRCPRTAAALREWPRWEVPGYGPSAVFSILDAKTRIPPHTGVHNTRLTVHLPLIIPPGCGFRVGGERREWIPGKAFVFDDSIEHEAWNDSDVPRAVLIFDIWSPFLSAPERELVSRVTATVGEYYGAPSYTVA
ncbi:MAG TPA: aspartyl/asparaginyl beta-hydroxylase domain-containing protein [Casimicrobiaceae bacterium]|nr:aspartyl/asparaginyl beta-hydroxylase domain-containing protein [Casimicrobiaceae bacterium]